MEIVMASEEDDNTTIKGTFSELGKKYLFADTATRGKNYYKLEIPESGIYDLYIYDDIDYDIEGGAIYTSDFSVLTDSESGEGFWFSANEQGRIGHLELEKGTYYISFYVYQQENMNASFAFTKGKEITGYKVTFPSTMRNVYSEGGYIELDELQTVLTFEDNSTETLKGTGSLWTLKAGIYPVYVKGGGHVENYQIEVKNLSDYPQTGAITELGRQTGMIETQGEVLKYSFTPTEAKKYYFYGVTGMDSDAMLCDSNGLRLTSSLTSNEEFSLSYDLEANETYYLTISFKDKTTGDLAFVINDVAEKEEHTHVFGDFVTIKEATCTENGMQEAVCKYCNEKQTKEIQKLEHAFGDYITLYEPTCEEKGMKYRICTRCYEREEQISDPCLLYTSDAADE